MSQSVNFKRTMFGVSKKNITEYIDKVSKDIDDKLLIKDREIATLKAEKEELGGKIKELEEKLKEMTKEMEAEKEKISAAFVKAEAGAQKIISDAKKEADSLLAITKEDIENQLNEMNREKEIKTAEMNIEISKQKEILDSYKTEITRLRDSIKSIVPKFDEILEKYN